jgi:hypothetical protein
LARLLTTAGFRVILPTMHARKLNVILAFALLLCCAATQTATAPTAGAQSAADGAKNSDLTLADASRKTVVTTAELKAMPHISVTFHNTHTNADESYSGVRLADMLAKLGAPLGSDLRGKALGDYIVATGSDGYKVVLALAEVDPGFHPGEVIVADTMNGQPLDAHNGPLKLVVTEDKRPARSVRNLVSIELKTLN